MRSGLKPASPEAMQLLLRGAVAMSRAEAAGIRIDEAYLDSAIVSVKKEIVKGEATLRAMPEYQVWLKHYGGEMSLNNRQQLGNVLFNVLGHKRNPFVKDQKTGRDKNNVSAFEHLQLPFVQEYQRVARLKKALVTNLYGIKKELVNRRVHPFADLHTAESYRGSMSKPNFQNQPIRNKEISKICRTMVVPSKDCVLLEPDYETQEVRVSYCYNKDPKLKYDILNGDMHRDRCLELYMLTPEQLGPTGSGTSGKDIRYAAKNMFVFREFYGGVYFQAAPALWDAITLLNLRRADGVSLHEHLKQKGIKKLGKCDPELEPESGTFEAHVRSVERRMWEESYPVYDQWKKDWWALYQRQGGVNTLTGFCMEGVFKRNQVLCDPIQGSSFHCLLWTAIEVQEEFIRRKMKSKMILQIHDSMLFDAHKREVDDVVELVKDIAVRRVAEHWDWIVVPLSVDFESSETNWFEKRPMKKAA